MGGNTDLIEEWKDIVLSGRKRDQLQAELGKEYAPQILGENAFALQQEWKAIELKWFLPKFFCQTFLSEKAQTLQYEFAGSTNTKPVRKVKCLSKE